MKINFRDITQTVIERGLACLSKGEAVRKTSQDRAAARAVKAGALACLLAGLAGAATPAHAQYTLQWGDDFNGAANSAPNSANWTYLTGNSFGTGEYDSGTNTRANSYLDGNGHLVIVALDNVGANPQWTSAHLETAGLQPVGPYGQVEANIQLAYTQGIGNAFWALGTNIGTVGWPNCGEIDIMESHGGTSGVQQTQNNGTIHGTNYADYGISTAIVTGEQLHAAYHIYGMYWAPYSIKFYLDSTTYANLDISEMASNENWPFNSTIYLLDTLGVAGVVSGPPDTTTIYGAANPMLTDYVHWNKYSAGPPSAPGTVTGSATSNAVSLSWGASGTGGATYDVYMNTVNSFAAGDLNTLEEYNVNGASLLCGALEPSTTYYFQVRAQNPGGESAASNTFQITTQGRGNASPVDINCGGFGIGNFMKDTFGTTGNPANATQITYNLAGLTNPAPNNVYLTYRWAPTSYAINDLNANALYTVRLHFVESEWTAVGARVFNVFVNGNPVLQNFDIFATAGGQNKPLIYQYTAMSDSNGNLEVDTTNGTADAALINAIEVIPNNGSNPLPGTPGGTTATGISSNQINLAWNAVSGATSYNVFRSLNSTFVPSASTYAENVTTNSVTDNVLYSGTTYYYKVAAVNASGEGQASGTFSAATQASANGTIGAINCGGTANGIFATDQDFTSSNAGNYTGTTIDTSLLTGTIPAQAVLQTDREGNFTYTIGNLAFGRPVNVTMYFMEPYWTAAGSRVFNVSINNNPVMTAFDIYAATGARFKAIQKTFSTYVNNQGQVVISFSPTKDNAEVAAIVYTQGTNPAITVPAATANNLSTTATMIEWPTDLSATGYSVYRSTTSGQETLLASGIQSAYLNTFYLDKGLTNGTKYYYQVTTTNYSGTSAKSGEQVVTPNPWPIPGTIQAENFDVGGEGVGYHSTAGGNYGGFYRTNENVGIEQCQDTGGGYDVCYASQGQWLNFTVNVAQAGNYTVDFRMASYGGGFVHIENAAGVNLSGEVSPATTNNFEIFGDSTATITLPAGVQTLKYVEDGGDYNINYLTFTYAGVPTVPPAPTGLTATAGAPGSQQIALAWGASTGATSYNVYRGTTSGGESATPIVTGITTTSYTNTGLTNGTTYYYTVEAVNSVGTSGASNEANATPTASPTVQINCGGAASGTWAADEDFSGGGTASWTSAIDTSALTGTIPPQAVLQTDRESSFTYTIPGFTANSSQAVTMYFVENYWSTAGSRTFNITINGVQVATNFDIYATAGAKFKAIQETYNTTANSSGQVVIVFTAVKDQSSVCGITVASGGGGTAPAAPTGLTPTAGNGQVALTWNASSGATSYNINRGTASGGETTIATGVTSTSYTNTGLTNGTTYYFTVSAVNSVGTSGASNEVSATPTSGAPGNPSGLGATAGNAQIALAWTAGSGATSYNVYRGTTAGGESATAIATGITAVAYTDTGLTNGQIYYYTVKAVNASGTSGASNEAYGTPSAGGGGTTVAIDCGSTTTQGSFVADTDFSGGGTASWTNTIDTSALTGTIPPQAVLQTDREANFTYTIPGFTAGSAQAVTMYFVENYWSTAGSRTFNITINGVQVATNFDIYATAGAKFKAVQETYNTTANSSGQVVITCTSVKDQSSVCGITVGSGGGGTAPAAPSGLTPTAGNTQVALTWTASSGATSYNVYRSTTSGGEGTTPIATGITATNYTNTGLTNGQIYYFTVTAVNTSGTSGASNEVNATPTSGVPAAPSGLTPTAGNTQVALTWTAGSGATSYNVYRGTTAGGESTTAVANVTTTNYTNTGLTNGQIYYFTVKAVNTSGTSGASNEVNATPTSGVPAAPSGLTPAAGNTQVALTWTASSGATSYNVYRGTTAGGESTTAVANVTTTSYTNTGLTNGQIYYFTVKAVNASGTSGASNEVNATPVASTAVSINCGGAASSPFVADVDFTGGGTASVTNAIDTSLLTGTIPPQAVLQSNRYGTVTYTIPGFAANSSHTVTLYFAEEYWTAAGKRTFNVSINGTSELTNFDIYATAGAKYKAVQKTFTLNANASGQFVITFTTVIDNAQVNGISIQ